MPAVPAIIAAGAAVGTGLMGSRAQSHATTQASNASVQSQREQLAYLRDKDAEEARRYDEEQRKSQAQWDAEQARLAPYRAASAAVLGRQMNMPVPGYSVPGAMPAGWQPGMRPSTSGATIGAMAGRPSSATPQQTIMAPQLTLADIAARRY